ncbi:MAG: MFS transporter [Tissierellia bacterium]|nr:MFS transporter [Bacillota bacterium]NLL22304.1 MFS transporter [Tissierellia bacterium]
MTQKVTREQRIREISWILYDCGNSAYSMAITTALFPVLFGMFSGNSMTLGYFNSLASIIIALLSPILGTIADYKDKKKRFFFFFFALGVLMTAALAFVPNGQWRALAFIYILSGVGFSGANIFYDSFLTDVTTDERMDMISARGFAYGYIASIFPFGISLAVVYFMGMDVALGYQIGFLITAVWWALLTVPMLRYVRQVYYVEPEPQPIRNSFIRLGTTFKEIRHLKVAFLFLLAYFFYIDGVDTIIKMVVPYATSVLGSDALDTFTLLAILLIIQIVAFPCALLFGRLANRFGTLTMIRVAIAIYIITVFFAYSMSTLTHVFILGGMVALAQGGIQALSRSYFARIIPKEKSNEFFGFYNIFGKFAAILGPAVMSLIEGATGVAKYSILGILPLFIIGFILTLFLPKQTERMVMPSDTP